MRSVIDHYRALAEDHGPSPELSMRDRYVRDAEIREITKVIQENDIKNPRILEVGCGNGYTAEKISNDLWILIDGIDFCEDLIEIANNRNCACTFDVDDVKQLHIPNNLYDIVYSERCLINLLDPNDQMDALAEIHRVLKPGGIYIMVEAFTDGLNNLNTARNDIGLPAIQMPYHNLFFDKDQFLRFIKGKFEITNQNQNFLSSYYFGSRVLYPALTNVVRYNTKFAEFFTYLGPIGNYSYIQVYVLKKIQYI
jgi:ubiquinone/menaquinone biosynthesis C-methylase UbiE